MKKLQLLPLLLLLLPLLLLVKLLLEKLLLLLQKHLLLLLRKSNFTFFAKKSFIKGRTIYGSLFFFALFNIPDGRNLCG
jgi:hypothetical protein